MHEASPRVNGCLDLRSRPRDRHPLLAAVIDRSRLTRAERPALPFELIHEAVLNALVHRDYDLTGATCHLTVTADTITVRSPGAPLPPITVEQLQAFSAPMSNPNEQR
jgi:ATP-dependent DNA helicase RecG